MISWIIFIVSLVSLFVIGLIIGYTTAFDSAEKLDGVIFIDLEYPDSPQLFLNASLNDIEKLAKDTSIKRVYLKVDRWNPDS